MVWVLAVRRVRSGPVNFAVKSVRAIAVILLAGIVLQTAPAAAFMDPTLAIRVELALADGDAEKALDLLKQGSEETEDHQTKADLMFRMAEMLESLGRHADAADVWVELAQHLVREEDPQDPALPEIWNRAAAALEKAGNFEIAVIATERALQVRDAAGLSFPIDVVMARLQRIAESDDEEAAANAAAIIAEENEEKKRAGITEGGDGFSTMRIYYGTDRARTGSEYMSEFYGGERGTLEFGVAEVSIPDSHKPGNLEKPSIWTLSVTQDPKKHIILQKIEPKPADEVFAQMRQQIEDTGTPEAFVFIHGFNVTFNNAARRTAQLAYDMNFDGLPILYSWPSRGSVMSYISDTAVVNLSGRRLTQFLEQVVENSGAERIHLIAHSMGNRALTDALELYALRNEGKPASFDQVLFTAPDLDAGLFAEMAKTIRPVARRLTLYASNEDWALEVSKRLHGDAPRAGQGGDSILLDPTFDTVDMTMLGEDVLQHSYFANNASALTDMFSLFWRDASPSQRCGMVPKENEDGSSYWHFDPTLCDGPAMLSTLAILKRGSVASITEARAFLDLHIGANEVDSEDQSRLLKALGKLFGN